MNDQSSEFGSLAPISTETPENDPLIDEFETAPQELDDVDKHVWRRHLENVQDLMLQHGLNFVVNKDYARAEAMARAKIEIGGETDVLTGLKNKNGLIRALDDLAANETRSGNNSNAVFIRADANGLKIINDKFGHKAGDEFLKIFGSTFNTVRGGDIVARDGGDEFGIILMNTDLEGANTFWERFNAELPEELSIVGGATVLNFKNTQESMHMADKLMYEAKRRSKEEEKHNCFLTTNDFTPPTEEAT